ncbi:MAG: hypothetical protein J5910_01010 [Lachnospiraceae bacterium]|nr:hypothetical protein [Lachnospiraceae bacterium]
MKKGFLKKIILLTASCVCAFALAGCEIVPSLNLSEEQSELVAEFAAGKLIEYVKGHPGGLMILEDVDRSEVNPGMKKEEEEPQLPGALPGEPVNNNPEPPSPEGEDGAPAVPESIPDDEALAPAPEAIAAPTKSIAESIGASGADITYSHYEVCSAYPDDKEELAFSMRAAQGKDLLVVHFNVASQSGEDVEIHTDSTDFKVRLMLNGSDRIRGDVTFLANDLTNYSGTVSSGETADGVFVFEIEKGVEVESLDLIILGSEGEQTYRLEN